MMLGKAAFVGLGAIACGLACGVAHAQDPLCWRARPMPACTSYLVTDLTVAARLDPAPGDERRYLITAELGWMRNVGSRNGVGATLSIVAHGARDQYASIENLYPYLGTAVMVRYRRWLSPRAGIELGLGTPFSAERALGTVQLPSLLGEVSVTYAGLVALTARVERTRYEQLHVGPAGTPGVGFTYPLGSLPASFQASSPDVDTAWYFGAKVSALPGALGIVAAGLLVAVSRIAYSS